MNLKKRTKIVISLVVLASILAASPFVIYLKVLPYAVSNEHVINFVEKSLNKYAGLKLDIKKPVLKTELSPVISFKVDELILQNSNNVLLLSVDNFDTTISFKEIMDKNIIIKKLGADYIFADINNLMALAPKQQEKKEQQKSEWNLDFFDSLLYVKKSLFLYKVEPNTYVSLKADDIEIDNSKKDFRYVHFNITSDIRKLGKNLHINIADRNSVFIKNKALYIQKCMLAVNNSKIYFNGYAARKKNSYIEIFTDKILVSDVLELIDSNIIENNLNEPLAFFKDLKGDFNFNIKLTKKDLNGVVNLNRISCKLIPVDNIPLMLEKGKIVMTKNDIVIKDFVGYYNNKKENAIEMEGTVKDYLKSIDTNLITRAVVTNDFAKNQFSNMVGIPITLVGGSTKTRLDIKAINNKIDLVWLFGLKSGQDILIDGASLTLQM